MHIYKSLGQTASAARYTGDRFICILCMPKDWLESIGFSDCHALWKRIVSLPIFSSMTISEIKLVVDTVKKICLNFSTKGAKLLPNERPTQQRGLSRTAEICLALAGLAELLPFLLLLAVIFKSSTGGSDFVPSKTSRARTRTNSSYTNSERCGADSNGLKLTAQDDYRLTPDGKWLRRYKLDELPQLWNVLRGECRLSDRDPKFPNTSI